MSLSWAKNHRGPDHGALFQENDRRPERSEQIDYDWCRANGEDPTAMEMAFARRLGHVVPRLELMGFTLDQARVAYEHRLVEWRDERASMSSFMPDPIPAPLTFEQFLAFANRQPVAEIDNAILHRENTLSGRGKPKGRFKHDAETVLRIPSEFGREDESWSERSYFANAINILHPYLMLRLLAENPGNLETDVLWQYGALVENGWASAAEFEPLARRTQTFLIATEGSSDAHILRHAFHLLRPEVEDFFRFIDVSEGHPFPGTGNLRKFAEGLAKIDVQNQAVFVFDNDAEGVEAHSRLEALALPSNLRAMLLPTLEAFRSFPARGPGGEHLADINGRAAAIECYLDHRLHHYPQPRVVWTNYKKERDVWQGALDHKDTYAKAFLRQTAETIAAGAYDATNIERVLDALVAECVAMASGGSAEGQSP